MNRKILKKTILSILFPLLIFVVMLIITASSEKSYVQGTFIFLTKDMVRQVVMDACLTTCVALAIWIQLKNGRFDFSGGASMILTAIIAGNLAKSFNNPWLLFVFAIVIGIVLSIITASAYIIGRLPIIICTIGMTLLYESITYVIFDAEGIKGVYANTTLSIFGRFPGIFLPFGLAIIIFIIFTYLTVAGRKGKILSHNQAAGVSIGINEKKNILVTYLFTGILIGLSAVIYVSQNDIAPQSGLATSGILFSYIVPVFMGIFIGLASMDVIGIVIAAIGMEIMNYGLDCINLGAGGWQQIIMGAFMLAFYTFSAQTENIKRITGKMIIKIRKDKEVTR